MFPIKKMHFHLIVICDLSTSTVFLHVASNNTGCSENVIGPKTCISIFSTTFDCSFPYSKRKWEIYDHKLILIVT